MPARKIENHPTGANDIPTVPIIIAGCGELSKDDPSLTASDDDPYEEFPDDETSDVQSPEVALRIAREIREVGNKLFKQGDTEQALEKYQSNA